MDAVGGLIINVPPRSGKSLLGSIALPSFVLGRHPTQRIISILFGRTQLKLRTRHPHPHAADILSALVPGNGNCRQEHRNRTARPPMTVPV